LTAATSLLVACGPGTTGDYLSPELRARVEALKTEAPELSTDRDVLDARVTTLWEWGNAYAMTGGVIPVDFPYHYTFCRALLRGRAFDVPALPYSEAMAGPDGFASLERLSIVVAGYTRELQIRDENPRAIGTVTLSDEGPQVVGTYVTLELTYTVGEMAMATGGGVMVANNLHTRFQGRDPAADNYVTARTSNAAARLERVEERWGKWTAFITRPAAAFRLVEGTLEPGDTVTVTLGDTSGGSQGCRLQTASNDLVVVPLYVDLEGNGNILALQWPGFAAVGEPEPAMVNGILPSIVAPGEPFRLAVRTEDRFKNPISGPSPAYEVLLHGQLFTSVPAGDQAVAVISDLTLDEPGVYRFHIRSADGSLTSRTNPVSVREDPAHRIYWGDTHGHVGFADGQGTPDGYFRFGRDFARLDFLTHSEHDIWTDAWEWQQHQDNAERYLDSGTFTTFLGYEWTALTELGGHHNVYFRTTRGRQRVSVQEGINLSELYQGLRQVHKPEDVLIIPHAHAPGDWRQNDAAMERVVEVQSGHGTFEFFGNKYLQNGFFVGFIGSSDNHNTHPGYSAGSNRQLGGLAAVMAPSNTREALFDALRGRLCYATTGERIIVEATLDGVPMGQRVADGGERTLACTIRGTEPIEAVDVIKNGEVVFTKRYLVPTLEPTAQVMVRFGSSTDVIDGYRTPRDVRYWRGSIEVQGARLAGFSRPWFYHPVSDDYRLDEADPDRIVFTTNTRGRSKGVLLELDGATAGSKVVVHLDASREAANTGADRPPEQLPAAELTFRLGDLARGSVVHALQVVDHVDTVDAQLVPGDAALDQEFSYTDRSGLAEGDYYYLRVRQVDGSVAWSSPWLMGAEE
jgi:hypothetical protein